MESTDRTLVCQNCFTDLCRKYPPEEQIQEAEESVAERISYKCFICRNPLMYQPKILYSKQVRKGEPFFPFLSQCSVSKDTKDILRPQGQD